MNTSKNSISQSKSKFKDSKVDIKEVFSEKTDFDSKVDDLSTFSKSYIKNPHKMTPILTNQKKAEQTSLSWTRVISPEPAKTSPSSSDRCSS